MAVTMKNVLPEVYRRFRGTYASIFRVEEYTSVKEVVILRTALLHLLTVRYEIFMAVTMKNVVPEVYRRFRGTYASIFRVEEYTSVKHVAILRTALLYLLR
jgi:5-hydroxyisourate hydrolase-like protein (transthyretin family)